MFSISILGEICPNVSNLNSANSLTFGVWQTCHSQVFLSHVEGVFQVLQVVLTVHFTHVNQSGPIGKHKHGLSVITGIQDTAK